MAKRTSEECRQAAVNKFLRLFTFDKETGCWPWAGRKDRGGYGCFYHDGDSRAHRFSYRHYIGPIPLGLNVLHKCDSPSCQNPNHLFLGTLKQNSEDMVKKGRARGNPAGKKYVLNQHDAQFILDSEFSTVRLAQFFGLHRTTIGDIKNGKLWAHLKKTNAGHINSLLD